MKYTAASVKSAIETFITNKGFVSKNLDSLICPMAGWIPDVEQVCGLRPQLCKLAADKECRRSVSILMSNEKTLYITLNFYFTISSTNHDGFIMADDSRLNWLIKRGDLDVKDLAAIE
ncbi:MAG: hypothetical protein FWE57_08825 [Chitinispirillia bacterium]|nr:hypothetical protein [Chitinispirillia bacterium]